MLQNNDKVENKRFWVLAICIALISLVSVIRYRYRVCYTQIQPEPTPTSLTIVADSNAPHEDKCFAHPYVLLEGNDVQTRFSVDFYPLLPKGLNVNRATQTLFTLLHGVGPVKAVRVVEERDRNGYFCSCEDFFQRTGISREKMRYCEEWLNVHD